MTESHLPCDVHLTTDVGKHPLPFRGRKKIDAQPRDDRPAVRILSPVDGKRKEVVVLEIHHRIELVHESVAKPSLSILTDARISIPSTAGITGEVVGLADGRTTQFHPRLQRLHPLVNGADDAGDVFTPRVPVHRDFPRLRITDIVEMHTVDVIVARHLLTHISDIAGSLFLLRVHESLVAYLPNRQRPAAQVPATGTVPLAYRNADHPRMNLHSPAMALLHGKLQRVVTRRPARMPRQAGIKRLVSRRVNRRCTNTCLKQHRVDIRAFQLVENLTELALLLLSIQGTGPVQPADSRQPDGTHLILRTHHLEILRKDTNRNR